jgi:multicomponent Na+:H+ antiporter subunit E
MRMLGWNLLIALAWCAVTGRITGVDLAVGFVVGYGILAWLIPDAAARRYGRGGPRVIRFLVFYAVEVVASSLRIAWDVITPRARRRPGILAVPLDVTTDVEIFVLTNLLTFSPGTLTLDVTADRRTMIVHDMFADDPEARKQYIKQRFERWVLRILR